jgi:hypothetical protein
MDVFADPLLLSIDLRLFFGRQAAVLNAFANGLLLILLPALTPKGHSRRAPRSCDPDS